MDKHNLLHPPLHVKNLEKKDEALLLHGWRNGQFRANFFDAHFEELPKAMIVPVKDLSIFLDSVHCQNVKAVFYTLLDYEIRQMVYEEIKKRKWHIFIHHLKQFPIMSMLFASKIDSKPGDVILIVLSYGHEVSGSELRRKPEGYSFICELEINISGRNINYVTAEVLCTCNPKYVLVYGPQCNDLFISLKSRVISSKNVINIETKEICVWTPLVMKTIFDQGNKQIIPFYMDDLAVTDDTNLTDVDRSVIINGT